MKQPTPSKKPYEKPAVIHREHLESVTGVRESFDPVAGKTGSDEDCTFNTG